MQSSKARLDRQGWALLLILAVLWSISFIFIKVAAAELPILTLVLMRVGLAAALLHMVVLASGRRYPTTASSFGRYALMAVFNNVLPGALIVYATPRIGAGAASILNATVPISTLLITHFSFADERITPAKLSGIGLAVAGVFVMTGPAAAQGLTGDLLAVGAMLLATSCYGLANAVGRSFGAADPIVSATCQLTGATLLLLPLTLIVDRPWTAPMPGAAALLSGVGLAVFSTALAYVLFFKLLARAGATNTSLVTLLIPVSGVLLAWAILGEVLALGEAAGMILIGLGLLVIDGQVARRLVPAGARMRPGT